MDPNEANTASVHIFTVGPKKSIPSFIYWEDRSCKKDGDSLFHEAFACWRFYYSPTFSATDKAVCLPFLVSTA